MQKYLEGLASMFKLFDDNGEIKSELKLSLAGCFFIGGWSFMQPDVLAPTVAVRYIAWIIGLYSVSCGLKKMFSGLSDLVILLLKKTEVVKDEKTTV